MRRRAPTERLRAVALAALLAAGCSGDGEKRRAEYAVWTASPQAYDEVLPFPGVPAPTPVELSDQTLRQIAHLSAGGDELRVQLSNLFGSAPLTIDAASVALSTGGDGIDVASQQPLTFSGETSVTLQPGAALLSDYAPLSVPPESDVAVSLYLAGPAPLTTVHNFAQQTAYLAPGNVIFEPALPGAETRSAYAWLTRIGVRSTQHPQVIVALGDSLTDGYGSTPDAQRRYPNFLSQRLLAQLGVGQTSVVNAGIWGNRLLNDGAGPSGESRMVRDVLGTTGATHVIILLGINDIGIGNFLPEQAVSADEVINGLTRLVAQANANGIRPFLGTLTPLQGTAAPYYDAEAELKRQQVNDWVRSGPGVTSIIDFDLALQDPDNPLALLPAYDSGDHLHLSDAGYAAMAEAIDPELFR